MAAARLFLISVSGLLLFGCSEPDADLRNLIAGGKVAASRLNPGPPVSPPFHRPSWWWREEHGSRTGPEAGPRGPVFGHSLCLDCHDPQNSCNTCHRFVGVPLVEDRWR
ncbi:MAG: hypothetical protein V1816_25150 [Pseudomonadota bacterium]